MTLFLLCLVTPVYAAQGLSSLVLFAGTQSGLALSGVAFYVYWNGSIWAQGRTGADGHLITPVVGNRTYHVTAFAPASYTPSQVDQDIQIPLNATQSYLNVTFALPNYQVVIRVLDDSSNPIPSASIQVSNGSRLLINGQSNSAGYLQGGMLPAGTYSTSAAKQYYGNVTVQFTLAGNGTLAAPTVVLKMTLIIPPPKGVYITFTSSQLANVAVGNNLPTNSFRWVIIRLPDILQVYFTVYNSPQQVINFLTAFQGVTYIDPTGNYYLRYTGRISSDGQAEFDLWGNGAQAVIVNAGSAASPFQGTPGRTYNTTAATKAGDLTDIHLGTRWFASFSWAPVTIANKTLPQVVVYDISGNKVSSTFMTAYNMSLIDYGGSSGFGIVLYRMITSGQDTMALWSLYSANPITLTPNIGFGTLPLYLTPSASTVQDGDTITVIFTIPQQVKFDPTTGVHVMPADYDPSYGLQTQETDPTKNNWQITFIGRNDQFGSSKTYGVTIVAMGNDGAPYSGNVIISVNPQFWRTLWTPVLVAMFILAFTLFWVIRRRRAPDPDVPTTMGM